MTSAIPQKMDVRAAFRAVGLKPRLKQWLLENGVVPTGQRKNRHGKATEFFSTEVLVHALRGDHSTWPRSKVWEFECRVRGVPNPGHLLVLLVEGCRPDYELLRAALFFALDPNSGFLDACISRDVNTKSAAGYPFRALADFVLRKVVGPMKQEDIRRVEGFEDDQVPSRMVWAAMKEEVQHWPKAAQERDQAIYNGALLLADYGEKAFSVSGLRERKPSSSIPQANFFVRRPSYLETLEPSVFPSGLVKDCGFYRVPIEIMEIPGISDVLDRTGKINFWGRSRSDYERSKEEIKELVTEVERLAGVKNSVSGFSSTIRSVLKAWNYRVNWDREMYLRGHRSNVAVPLKKDQVARIFGEPSRKRSSSVPQKGSCPDARERSNGS